MSTLQGEKIAITALLSPKRLLKSQKDECNTATAMNVCTILYSVITFYYYLYLHNPIIGIMYSKMLGALLCMQRIEIDFIHSSVCMGLRWLLCGIDEGLGLNGQTYSSWMIGGDCVSSPISSNQYLVLLPKDDEPHQPMNPFGKKPWSSLTTG